ncbi:MAG: UDP-N-acetylmuramate dehydrogenase, partial [Terriglobia bacterium]
MSSARTLEIREDVSLKPFTTFKIGGPARYFTSMTRGDQVEPAIEFAAAHRLPVFVLGGGSNLLVSDSGIEAFVLHPVNEGLV